MRDLYHRISIINNVNQRYGVYRGSKLETRRPLLVAAKFVLNFTTRQGARNIKQSKGRENMHFEDVICWLYLISLDVRILLDSSPFVYLSSYLTERKVKHGINRSALGGKTILSPG